MMETKAYEHTTETQSGPPPIRAQTEYLKSLEGILKIVEIALCIIVLICASVDYWYWNGGGWVQFVAASAMIGTLILLLFHFLNIIARIPGPWTLIEFVYYCVYSLLFAIAAITASFKANNYASVGAAAFFCYAATIIYAIDTYFMYRAWQRFQHPMTGGIATTTTTTTYETRTQY